MKTKQITIAIERGERTRNKGKEALFSFFSIYFWITKAKQDKKIKRQRAVRKISAGEPVRFHMDKKLVVDGEKTERDWIFPSALKGKNRSLNTQRIHRIKSSVSGFLWLRKRCELTTEMSKHTSATLAKR